MIWKCFNCRWKCTIIASYANFCQGQNAGDIDIEIKNDSNTKTSAKVVPVLHNEAFHFYAAVTDVWISQHSKDLCSALAVYSGMKELMKETNDKGINEGKYFSFHLKCWLTGEIILLLAYGFGLLHKPQEKRRK